jgi:uncharacterized membrane protein HdeD (DUF308 family)
MLRALLHSCDNPKAATEGSLLHGLLHSCDGLVNNNGACWILALDGILLVPLIFAMFFYPMAALASVAVLAVLTLVAFGVARAVNTHHHRHGV